MDLPTTLFHLTRPKKVWSGSQDGRGSWPRRSAIAAASSLDAIARRTRPRAVRVRHRRRRQHIRRPSAFRTTQPTAPAPGKYSGLALPIGPVPGAMPNKMSREAAAPQSAAPPRSLLRSMFARCAGEEQEQQAADAADASSIGPQPSYMHGTRRPLAAGQLGHLRISLMHSARPSIPLRRPSPALSRTCRPLSSASRAPHALPSHLCTRCQQVSRSEGLFGSGGWAQGGRVAG